MKTPTRFQDINDHPPVFGGPYRATIREDDAVGKSILKVQATDADPTVSNKVSIFILFTNISFYFSYREKTPHSTSMY